MSAHLQRYVSITELYAVLFRSHYHDLVDHRQVNNADALQVSLRDLSNWSVGPSFRGYVSNADSYVRIRVEEF